MSKYLGLGFLATTLASIYMFIRALSNGFSADVGLCMTRGGQSCFATSNPVWTAATLKWLAPLVILVSIIGVVVVGILGDNLLGSAVGISIAIGIIYLALAFEIKDKSNWMAPAVALSINKLIS